MTIVAVCEHHARALAAVFWAGRLQTAVGADDSALRELVATGHVLGWDHGFCIVWELTAAGTQIAEALPSPTGHYFNGTAH